MYDTLALARHNPMNVTSKVSCSMSHTPHSEADYPSHRGTHQAGVMLADAQLTVHPPPSLFF